MGGCCIEGDSFLFGKRGWGLTRRLRRGSRACSPMGLTQLQRANRRRSGKQQAERAAVRAALTEGLTRRLGTDCVLPSLVFSPASVPEGFQRASGKPFGAPVGAYPFPRRGLTRRLRRGRWVCRPEEGSTFFRRERKYQRKHAARRLQRRPAPLRVIRKYRRSGHCRARLLYLLRPASR